MARKRNGAGKPSQSHFSNGNPKPLRWLADDAAWGGFVAVKLDEATHQQFNAWVIEDGARVWEALTDAVAEGLKFSLAYDAENEAWVASLTGKGALGVDLRCSLSARAGTEREAIALLIFKHEVMAGGDWSDYRPKVGNFLKWG